MSGEKVCPMCGPTTVEQHPRRRGVMRCANCKEWLSSEKHRPVGAYLPVGQLDGDCACGRGSYPCPDTPAPEQSEVAETTAGEREVEALAKVLAEHEIDLSALRRDRSTAVGYWMACMCGFEWTPDKVTDGHRAHLATALAALLDRERREVGERIAQAIATSVSPGFGLNHDGSEDSHAMAYVEGLKDAHDIARDEAAR